MKRGLRLLFGLTLALTACAIVAHLPKGLAQHMPMPSFFDTYHPKAMQRVVDMMKKQGLLPKSYDVKDYVYNP